jgi:hypothetical protein
MPFFSDTLLISVRWLRAQAANIFFNLFRGVHKSRHILQKDNSAAEDIMSEKTQGCQLIHLFEGNNCKVHEKPDKKYEMEHKHFDPGAVRTDSQPANPVAKFQGM